MPRDDDRYYLMHTHDVVQDTRDPQSPVIGSERHAHHVDQRHAGSWSNPDHDAVPFGTRADMMAEPVAAPTAEGATDARTA